MHAKVRIFKGKFSNYLWLLLYIYALLASVFHKSGTSYALDAFYFIVVTAYLPAGLWLETIYLRDVFVAAAPDGAIFRSAE